VPRPRRRGVLRDGGEPAERLLHRRAVRGDDDARPARLDGARRHSRGSLGAASGNARRKEARRDLSRGALMQLAIQVGGGQVRHDQTGIEAIIEETQAAEALGFDAVFVPDHYVFESLGTLQETPAYELFFVMATLAQHTKRILIGSHVACM